MVFFAYPDPVLFLNVFYVSAVVKLDWQNLSDSKGL